MVEMGIKMKEKKPKQKVEKAERVPTGVPGLDNMMEGGFEKGSVILIAGGTGTGKSIFSTQYLVNGATKYNETGLYITFEEKKKEIQKHMKRFGWDLADLEKKKKIFVYEYSPTEINKFIKDEGSIEDVIRARKINRLVFDSITSFAVLHDTEAKRRKAIVQLLDTIKKWECTAVLPSEIATIAGEEAEVRARFGLEYLADALLAVYSVRKGDIREMALEIVKMRGTNHSKKLAPMKITDKGITLYPDQPFFAKSF